MTRRSRLALILVVLHCVAGAAGAAHADASGEKAVRDLIGAIDASANWSSSAGAIRSEGSAVVVEGWTIATEDGTVKLVQETARFEGLTRRPDGGFSVDRFSASGQKLTAPMLSAEIPNIDAERLVLVAADLPRFDKTRPATALVAYYRFAALQSIARLSSPEITLKWSTPANGTGASVESTAAYKGIVMDGLGNGVISRQNIDQVTVETRNAVPGASNLASSSLSYRDVESLNINLNAFLRVADPGQYHDGRGDGIWMVLADRARIGKVLALAAGKEVLSLASIELQDIKVRQPKKPLATIIDSLVASPPSSNADDLAFLTGDLKSLLTFAAVDSLTLSKLSAGEASEGSAGFETMTLDRLSPDGLDRLAIDGAWVAGPDFKATLASFALQDVQWASIDAFADMMRFDQARAANNGKPDPALVPAVAESAFNLLPRLGSLSLSGLSISVEAGPPITIDSYIAKLDEFIGNYPISGSGSLSGLDVPGALLRTIPDAGPTLDTLGYSSLNLSLDGSVGHNAKTGAYVAVNKLTLRDGGTLFLDYRLGGITEAAVKSTLAQVIAADGEPDPNQLMSLASGLTFEGLRLRFEDNSLTRRALALAAKLQSMDEPTLTATAVAMAQLGLIQLKRPQFTEQALAAITAYLKAPKSFTVLLKPAQPVPLLQLMQLDPGNPGILIDLLGASVTAND